MTHRIVKRVPAGTLFGAYFRTTDGRKWSVGFLAHSWGDARSIAEQCNVTVDGVILETLVEHTLERVPSLSHLAGWEFAEGRFRTEVSHE